MRVSLKGVADSEERRCSPRLSDADSLTVDIEVALPQKFACCEPEPYDESQVL